MKKRITLMALLCVLLIAVVAFASCGKNECDHEYKDATCTEPKTCEECGKTKGSPLGHNFVPATCTTPEVCSVCGFVQSSEKGHSWAEATCTAPMTCTVCFVTEGSPLSHRGGVATCLELAVCDVCHEEYGTLNDTNHVSTPVWNKRHSYHWQTYECCGAVASLQLSHSMSGGVCLTCGYDPSLELSSVSVASGTNTFTMALSVNDNVGIIGLDLSIYYDYYAMTLIDVTKGSALAELEFSSNGNYYSGSRVIFDGVDIADENIRDGEIIILTFELSSSATPGQYSVYFKADVIDKDYNRPSMKLVGGIVTVE